MHLPSRAGCAHGLALVDATLDTLEDRGRAERAGELAAELCRPAWSRALVELAAHAEATEREPAAIELWWMVEDELRVPTLTAIVKKQPGAGSATARGGPRRCCSAEHRDACRRTDSRIAEALVAWRAGPRAGYPAARSRPRSAIRA